MSSTATAPEQGWDQEVASGGGLYLKIEPNSSVRLRITSQMPLSFQEEFNGKKQDRWAVIAIVKEKDASGQAVRSVKGFRFGVTIFKAIQGLWKNEDWGDPRDYDLTITRKGAGLDTEYTVVPSPKKPMSDAEIKLVNEAGLDLVKLFIENKANNGQVSVNGATVEAPDPFADD